MPVDAEHKREVEIQIVNTIADTLDKDQVELDELPKIARFVLARIDTIQTEDQLAEFLTELTAQWEFFKPILSIELGRVKSELEKQIARDVLKLAHSGQIEEAIRLAKTMTEGQK